MKTVFCGTSLELETVGTTYLKMLSFGITDKLMEGLQVLTEGETDTLIFTESVLEEQMSESEFIEYIILLNNLYPKRVRFVYVKYKRNSDKIVETLYDYDNWDVYYNTKISELSESEINALYEERKIPDKHHIKKTSTEDIVNSGLKLKDKLMDTFKTNKDLEGNFQFQSIVSRNMDMVKDMVYTLDYLQRDLINEQKARSNLQTLVMKSNQNAVNLNDTINSLKLELGNRKNVNEKLIADISRLQAQHNSLVNGLQDLLFVDRLNTLNYRTKIVDSSYRNPPIVLYFKQVSHINHFTRFIQNLTKVMNDSVGLTKLYVIESETNLVSIPRYSRKGFSYVTDGTPLPEFLIGDLLTCGIDSKVLDFLVDNSMSVDYLILVDKTGVDFDLVTGPQVLKIITANSEKDVEALGLEKYLHLTNSKSSTLYLPSIREYSSYMEKESLELSLVSSLDITKRLLKAFSEFNNISIGANTKDYQDDYGEAEPQVELVAEEIELME